MAKRPMLVVVVVEEPGLRSVLAAELAQSGVDLLTAASLDGELVDRPMARQPAMLIVDEAEIEGDPGRWIERQWLDRAWKRVVVLTLDMPFPADADDWLVYLDKSAPARVIADRVVGLVAAGQEKAAPADLRFAVEFVGNA